tara:strand:- start:3285 stop:3530 length:246 start_codon:yes stop_codon:yes gene_type:complete
MQSAVRQSINDPTGQFCVDIIENEKGHCCYKCFRRDPEDNNGWFPFGPESKFSFSTPDAAFAAAALEINWLKDGFNQRESG